MPWTVPTTPKDFRSAAIGAAPDWSATLTLVFQNPDKQDGTAKAKGDELFRWELEQARAAVACHESVQKSRGLRDHLAESAKHAKDLEQQLATLEQRRSDLLGSGKLTADLGSGLQDIERQVRDLRGQIDIIADAQRRFERESAKTHAESETEAHGTALQCWREAKGRIRQARDEALAAIASKCQKELGQLAALCCTEGAIGYDLAKDFVSAAKRVPAKSS
jgi:hypothetical protein